MEEFNLCIDTCGFFEMQSIGSSFSWSNGHQNITPSWDHLDRSFLNVEAMDAFSDATLKYIPRTSSDHALMVINLDMSGAPYGYPFFKFQQMWTSHDSFSKLVSQVCEEETIGLGLFRLASKLKQLKIALKVWNKHVFRRMQVHIEELESRIERIEASLQDGYSEDLKSDLLAS
ncbi:uncharacterized protein LOC121262689 [Juglans microcarpa x Juglans regia]|uniref:uncharacterized protein LOC121262689 n=1 Tax=Juglans microcarpa x Juglans regia TaxID=2249226 RepID=UPI001B7E5878|nr:uncharacterized protein LOC121262689 [Juglans microcarpa x Juglans regia]